MSYKELHDMLSYERLGKIIKNVGNSESLRRSSFDFKLYDHRKELGIFAKDLRDFLLSLYPIDLVKRIVSINIKGFTEMFARAVGSNDFYSYKMNGSAHGYDTILLPIVPSIFNTDSFTVFAEETGWQREEFKQKDGTVSCIYGVLVKEPKYISAVELNNNRWKNASRKVNITNDWSVRENLFLLRGYPTIIDSNESNKMVIKCFFKNLRKKDIAIGEHRQEVIPVGVALSLGKFLNDLNIDKI